MKNNCIKKFLTPIKKKIKNKTRLYLTIKHVYPHLCELSNEEILDYYQVKSLKELDAHIEYVKEILKKKKENDEEKLDALDTCFCVDSHGDFKYLYQTKKEAEKQRLYSLKTKRVKLTLYTCPFHCGWHLSKV
ncbi:MAG: Unknown protein [uncultured Sulfurovum sp.]|uniref:Uncharacterized protein n=1 Tax=uncultured Sulfurovum sp. TaxID=269237 RepID=A0A6S6T553_9BACT|nr:MAG: Unknown protein [uncultured Sulfurovum sp.]